MNNSKPSVFTRKELLLILVVSVAVLVAWLFPKIPQDPAYHLFVDQRILLSIPNFWNVLSNAPFVLVGLAGLFRAGRQSHTIDSGTRHLYILFFAGITAVTLGSSYYHLWPGNQTLVWDRLPMTIAFMSLLSIIVAEFISLKAGRLMLFPLLGLGVGSVFYWIWTETQHAGDLRLYGLVQFLPMLLIPMILLMYRSRYTHAGLYWLLLALYGLAKLAELGDVYLFELTGLSGHSFKHLFAASSAAVLYLALGRRSIHPGHPS